MWQSNSQWPDSIMGISDKDNVTTLKHGCRRTAERICRELKKGGFGGRGLVFPIKTWVSEVSKEEETGRKEHKMVRHKFSQGQKLKSIYFQDNGSLEVGVNCDEIEVVMELGNGSHMPWFSVTKDDAVISKWNAALVEGVKYL